MPAMQDQHILRDSFQYLRLGGRLDFAPFDLPETMQGWVMRPPQIGVETTSPQELVATWLNVARGIITRGSQALVSPDVERWVSKV